MKKPKQEEVHEVDVLQVHTGRVTFYIVGTEAIIFNQFSEKAKHQLLAPGPRKNAAEKAALPKHNPVEEFRSSAHQLHEGPTLLGIDSGAFKQSIAAAALDIPGVQKTQIGRLTYVEGQFTHIYGIPKLKMDMVRSADINRTPDVRTRAAIQHWAAKVSITFVMPLLKEKSVSNLFAAAGLFIGVGDWRSQKGSGNFGSWHLVNADDKEFNRIVKEGCRKQQIAAMAAAEPYDADTSDLLAWWKDEVKRRGFDKVGKVAAPRAHGKPNGNAEPPTEQEVTA